MKKQPILQCEEKLYEVCCGSLKELFKDGVENVSQEGITKGLARTLLKYLSGTMYVIAEHPEGWEFTHYLNDEERSYGITPFENMFLHSPGSVGVRERSDQVNKYLKEFIKGDAAGSLSIADLGCGLASYERNLLDDNPNLDVLFTCVDNDSRAVEVTSSIISKNGYRDKIEFEDLDAFTYLESNSVKFDLVVSIGIIDWLEKEAGIDFLSKIRDTLSSDGVIITSVVDKYRFMSITDKILGMEERMPKNDNDLAEMLKAADYQDIEVTTVDSETQHVARAKT